MNPSRYALAAAVVALWGCEADALVPWSWHSADVDGPRAHSDQRQPGDEVARKLTDPGVYYDSADGSPFIPVPGLVPEGVEFKKSSTPQPFVHKDSGATGYGSYESRAHVLWF